MIIVVEVLFCSLYFALCVFFYEFCFKFLKKSLNFLISRQWFNQILPNKKSLSWNVDGQPSNDHSSSTKLRACSNPGRKGASTLDGQFVPAFYAAYFVHIMTFHFSFGVIFHTLGRLLTNWSVLRMQSPLRFAPLRGEVKYPHMLLVSGW